MELGGVLLTVWGEMQVSDDMLLIAGRRRERLRSGQSILDSGDGDAAFWCCLAVSWLHFQPLVRTCWRNGNAFWSVAVGPRMFRAGGIRCREWVPEEWVVGPQL